MNTNIKQSNYDKIQRKQQEPVNAKVNEKDNVIA